jgi:hypothetical protein
MNSSLTFRSRLQEQDGGEGSGHAEDGAPGQGIAESQHADDGVCGIDADGPDADGADVGGTDLHRVAEGHDGGSKGSDTEHGCPEVPEPLQAIGREFEVGRRANIASDRDRQDSEPERKRGGGGDGGHRISSPFPFPIIVAG